MSRSIHSVAQEKLGDMKPGERLRNELNTVFRIRTDKNTTPALRKWLGEVVKERAAGSFSSRKEVTRGFEATVSNALVLIYLLGGGVKARDLITAVYDSRYDTARKLLEPTWQSAAARDFEFAVLGVVPEKRESIIDTVLSEDFDILRDHLPSPFEGAGLSIIARHFGQDIPWSEYRKRYEEAESCFERGDLHGCIGILDQLREESVVRIPVAERLLKQARRKHKDHEDLRAILDNI